MSMSDPIADLCTRIRNATMRKHPVVMIPFSKVKQEMVRVLQEEGFVESWELDTEGKFARIAVSLKYDNTGDSVIRRIQRVSKPGRRVHLPVSEIHPILEGQGVSVVTTSQGVLSDRSCRKQNVGGEILCQVW